MNKNVKWVTKTAILLALTLVFQSLRMIIPQVMIPGLGQLDQYIIGSLVNATLIVATLSTGISSGIVIGVATPVIALLQGEIAFPLLVPAVALGNIAIVVIIGFLFDKNKIMALIAGAVGKFIVLYTTINLIVLPLLIPTLPADKGATVKVMMSFKFGYPQLITAAIGGLIVYLIYPSLKSRIEDY